MNLNYKVFLTNDLINAINTVYIKGYNNHFIPKYQMDCLKDCFTPIKNSYLISGTINDNYIPKDKFKPLNHLNLFDNNYNYNKAISKKKNYQIGYKSFIAFIKPFINVNNVIDYFNRLPIGYNTFDLSKDLFNTFKSQKAFKINLNEFDVEKINKQYLLFKNGLTIGNYRLSFIKYDEFIKNISLKSSFKIYQQIDKHFFNKDYTNSKFMLDSYIIIGEKLNNDNKNIFILCNNICYNDILKLLKINSVKWYKPKNDKLLKEIKAQSYSYTDYTDLYDSLIEKLNNDKKSFKKLDKKANFLIDELNLMVKCNNTKSKRFDRLNNQLELVLSDLNDLSNNMEHINKKLIELDRKTDEFENNQLEYKKNLSLQLKSYI